MIFAGVTGEVQPLPQILVDKKLLDGIIKSQISKVRNFRIFDTPDS
jgi:hypothetical protein